MSPTAWTLVPLPTRPKTLADYRALKNRFTGAKHTMNDNRHLQIAVPVPAPATRLADDDVLAAAVTNYRNQQNEPDTVGPLLFDELVKNMKFDPFAPAKVPSRPRRERRHDFRNAKGLTARVWASILSDGTVDPSKAVPSFVTNTGELPVVNTRS